MSEFDVQQINLLKRNWHRYIENKKNVAQDARGLAQAIGSQILNFNSFYKLSNTHGRVIVIINGNSTNPTVGHSLFLTNKKIHELTYLIVDDTGKTTQNEIYSTKYPLYRKNKSGEIKTIRAVITNKDNIKFTDDSIKKYTYLIEKGVVFSLNKDAEKYFSSAFNTVRHKFTTLPYSYGLGYNCNTFVFDVLREIFNLKIKNRGDYHSKKHSNRQCIIF